MGNVFRREVGVFLIFLAISAILWFVTSLNEVVQRQIVYNVEITNVPDSVTFIKSPPQTVTVSVVGRGSHMLRHWFGSRPKLNINFKKYKDGNRLILTHSSMLELVQSRIGDERQIQDIFPDTIGIYYTTNPPVKVPVKVDVTASTRLNVHLYGAIIADPDSVSIYTLGSLAQKIHSINTADIHFAEIGSNSVFRVPLVVPPGCKAVPDSVNVVIKVEPYVSVEKSIAVQAVGVPSGVEMILIPNEVKTIFRVPQSEADKLPDIRLVADYNSLSADDSTHISIYPDPYLPNVFPSVHTVEYYLNHYGEDERR